MGGGCQAVNSVVHFPFPHSQKICASLTCPHLPSAAVMGSAALWGHGLLNCFKVFVQKSSEIEPKMYFFIDFPQCARL